MPKDSSKTALDRALDRMAAPLADPQGVAHDRRIAAMRAELRAKKRAAGVRAGHPMEASGKVESRGRIKRKPH
jgi:hypothetical protein